MALRGLKPVPVESFGGLDTTTDHTDLGWKGALAASNVTFEPGIVRTRDGFTQIGNSAVGSGDTQTGLIPVRYGSTNYMLIASIDATNTYVDKVQSDGTTTAVGNWAATATTTHMVNIGTATTTLSFIATEATLRKYDGTTLGTSVGKPRYLAVTPVSNRLVQAWFPTASDSPTGSNGSFSTVFFSDAGAPETFGANNYVTLHPGDGEEIRGVAAWRELLFVVKQSKCFVFYGESTDSSGNPVFNYRTVSLPSVMTSSGGQGGSTPVVAAGRRGVYVWTGDGLYLSAGGDFTKVSRPLDTTFQALGTSSLFYGLSCAGDRVFMKVYDGSAFALYVYDEITGDWCTWALAETEYSGFSSWPAEFEYGRVVCYLASSGGVFLYRSSPTATSDPGGAITASYQSGWNAPAGAGVEVTVRETELTGTGSPLFSWARDFGSFDTATAVTLGTSPAVARGYHRVAKAGENLSFKISSTSGAWSVRRVVPMLRDVRGPGAKTS